MTDVVIEMNVNDPKNTLLDMCIQLKKITLQLILDTSYQLELDFKLNAVWQCSPEQLGLQICLILHQRIFSTLF